MKTIPPGLLEEMTRRLAAEFKPEAVILFGSHAWGQPAEDSDVDLLVILPGDTPPQIQDESRAYRCLRGMPVSKDILLKSRAQVERYRHVPASLERKILERGQVLYQSDSSGGARAAPVPVRATPTEDNCHGRG
jgi:predicted nucleotidyltransferase